MPPPTPLSIKASSLQRLVKEKSSYQKELEQQQKRIEKLEGQQANGDEAGEEGNNEFMLGQEKRALEETKRVFPGIQSRIDAAIEALEAQLESDGDNAPESEVQKAKEVLDAAKKTGTSV
ncbi:putative tubulin-specific chaperone [Phaeomoniella chlamydospora]|uniref:Tubulin-specific chaperone A n=1 Tax=Phaeomoniella chlamydospora TaxID=158046 RepID=A0A0G2F2L9_PHACM|nr:putative tubulin-specific chaperone [Phaeomoniella chlamydospora]